MNPKKVNLFGTKIDSLSMEDTVSLVDQIIQQRIPRQHAAVNAFKFALMYSKPELKDIINSSHIVNADGLPVVWALRLLGMPTPERVTGIDLFQLLVKHCAENGYRPYFFGAREEIVSRTIKAIRNRYPDIDIAGYRNGYFFEKDEEIIARNIRESQADMLFVGISSPIKESFLNKWMHYMQIPFCMGVGGSFDIVAGITKRAPVWMQKSGLEWFYRVLQEPRRLLWRYTKTNTIFMWMILKEFLRSNGR